MRPFRTDLYKGTAAYYDRYRPPYPEELFHDLRRRLPVTGAGRLLDLACGTGQIALPLAGYFREVVAVDQEPESVAFGRDKAEAAGIGNIAWRAGAAESADVDGPFELVAIGTAFHRLDRAAVAHRARAWLAAGGGVALLWSPVPSDGEEPWQKAMEALLAEWTERDGLTGRLPTGWMESIEVQPHEQVLREAGLDYVGKFEFPVDQTWTVETLTGFVYSTSILSRAALGDHVSAFEHDLEARLGPFADTDGTFRTTASFAYELALQTSL